MTMRIQRGFASILALLFLSLFAAIGVAYAALADSNHARSQNCAVAQSALFQAEGGLTYIVNVIRQCNLGANSSGTAMMDTLAADLATLLDGTANLNGAVVGHTPGTTVITVPAISLDAAGRQFQTTITLSPTNASAVVLLVTGQDGSITHSVSLGMLATTESSVFNFGIASQGGISLAGNASVKGVNNASEANILTEVTSTNDAYNLTGNVSLAGDISATNPNAYVSMTGNVSIGGATGDAASSHIHIPVAQVDFPEVDPTVFEPFATNIVNSTTSTTGNKTFTNIRIKANTNPTFSGNITVQGVVFVETPNQVTFAGNLNLTGVVVTQDAGDNAYTTNTINFTGNTTTAGVASLPNTTAFATLRTMPGSFLLAPGFGVSFSGNFGTVNGTMAADAFTFNGNAGGTINGTLINYGNSTLSLAGNSQIKINRAGGTGSHPGFMPVPTFLAGQPNTYVEN
jgi:Tfp pilus assembly protein PilX